MTRSSVVALVMLFVACGDDGATPPDAPLVDATPMARLTVRIEGGGAGNAASNPAGSTAGPRAP